MEKREEAKKLREAAIKAAKENSSEPSNLNAGDDEFETKDIYEAELANISWKPTRKRWANDFSIPSLMDLCADVLAEKAFQDDGLQPHLSQLSQDLINIGEVERDKVALGLSKRRKLSATNALVDSPTHSTLPSTY